MKNRFVWFVGVDMYLLMEMEEDKPVGSILPQEDGSCIIRWGHHGAEEPMHEELIDAPKYPDDPFDVIMYAAGAIEAKLRIGNDHDSRALIDHVCRLREDKLHPELTEYIRAQLYFDTDSVTPTAQIRKEALNQLYGEAAAELHPESLGGDGLDLT